MQSQHNEEVVQVCLTDRMRCLVVPPNSKENLCSRVQVCSGDSSSSCDSETEVLCQGVQNVLSSGDLGFSALLAKENIVEGRVSPITIASGSSVSEAFPLCKGETATFSSSPGEEVGRVGADLLMPATPVDYSSVILSSIWAFGTPRPSAEMCVDGHPEAQGPRCPSLTTALGSQDDPVSMKGVHKQKLCVSSIFAQKRLSREHVDGRDSVPTQASLNIPDSDDKSMESQLKGSVPSFNVRSKLSKNNLLFTSATCNQYASFPPSHEQTLGMSAKYGFSTVPNIHLNRWGIPCGMGLCGGGESAANGWGATAAQPAAWGNNTNNQSNAQGHWGAAAAGSANRPGAPPNAESQSSANNLKTSSGAPNSSASVANNQTSAQNAPTPNSSANQQTPQPQNTLANQQASVPQVSGANASNSWAQAAGKNISASSNSSDVQKLQNIKEALLSCEGWGGENVNQETSWDLPQSPEPSKDAATPHWKIVVNNGCDLWENNLRNGGVAPPKEQQAPWGKDPTFNYGGTWGEDDVSADTSNVWIKNSSSAPAGPPGTFPPNQQNMWMGHQAKAPEWSQGSTWGDHGPNRPGVDPNSSEWGSHKNAPHGAPHMPSHLGAHPNHPGPPNHPSRPLNQVSHGGPHGSHPPSHPGLHPGSHPPPHNGPHVPHPGHSVNHPMHSHNAHSAPHQGSHGVAPPAGSLVSNRWNGSHPKDPKSSGWDELSPPAVRRDDGTAIWAKPTSQQPNAPHWKDGGQNHMMQRPGSNAMQGGRLPGPPMPGPMKSDQKMWPHQSHNGSWSDNSHDVNSPVWGDDAKPGWNEAQANSASWMKPKMQGPTWPDSDMDATLWNSQNKSGAENAQQVRALMGHIQVAAQAGYLNPSILNQPLSQNTLAQLNQMLSLISVLHKLIAQQNMLNPQMHVSKSVHNQVIQLNNHIHKTKQQIQNIQNQITVQQAAFGKQQHSHHSQQSSMPGQSHMPPNIGGPPNAQADFQSGLPDQFYNKFTDMNVSDAPGVNPMDQPGSRLRQWKQPMEHPMSSGISNEFVRTPGKPQSHSSPNLTPLLPGSNSAWSANTRPSESGWPDSASSGPEGSSVSVSGDKTGHIGSDSAWPAQTGAGSYGLDIKPFEPGKPWMMKNIEDDPTVTPGSVTRSPLSLGIQDSDLLNSITKTTTTSTTSELGGGGSLSTLPLQSNTWTFNPGTGPQSSNSPLSGESKLVVSGNRSKSSWSDGSQSAGTLSSDLWGPPGNKTRGPPPGISANSTSKPSGSNWGAIGRSTSWSADQQRNQSNSALHSANNAPWPSSQPPSTWLTLKNLTPQIDGSTLKTLCLQHGPLINFHLSLNHGIALVHYGSREEAVKAQGNLNNCLLGNTTILAEFASEAEVNQWVSGGGAQSSSWTGSGRGSTPTSQCATNTKVDSWGGSTGGSNSGAQSSASLWSNGATSGASSLWSAPSFGSDSDQHRNTPSSLKSFLPDGLLNPETM